MKKIFKYVMPGEITMPGDAILLTVQMQNNVITLWALVDESKPLIFRKFYVVGTGQKVNDEPGVYVGTVQDNEGYVWHLFDLGEA